MELTCMAGTGVSYGRQTEHLNGIDTLKGICAFLIVCIHCPFPGEAGQYFLVLTRIAVPIFFMITGFFYNMTVEAGKEIKQIRKILILMIKANLLYFLWNLFYAAASGRSALDYLSSVLTFKKLAQFLVLNQSPFGSHLWYLGAILYVLLIAALAGRLKLTKVLYVLTPVLLAGDLILGKYSLLLLKREFPYILVRNFLFVGIPYFCIGRLLSKKTGKHKKSVLFALTALFSFTSLLERYLLVQSDLNTARDHYISSTLLAVTVFLLFLDIGRGGRPLPLEKIGRKYSGWVYIVHPIFITVLSFAARQLNVYESYQFVAPVLVYFAAVAFVAAAQRFRGAVRKNLS